jgi:hypothetical protein
MKLNLKLKLGVRSLGSEAEAWGQKLGVTPSILNIRKRLVRKRKAGRGRGEAWGHTFDLHKLKLQALKLKLWRRS